MLRRSNQMIQLKIAGKMGDTIWEYLIKMVLRQTCAVMAWDVSAHVSDSSDYKNKTNL